MAKLDANLMHTSLQALCLPNVTQCTVGLEKSATGLYLH